MWTTTMTSSHCHFESDDANRIAAGAGGGARVAVLVAVGNGDLECRRPCCSNNYVFASVSALLDGTFVIADDGDRDTEKKGKALVKKA